MSDLHLQSIIIEPSHSATAAVIWLHGLGADGNDFVPIIPLLNIPEHKNVRFIFPHAHVQPVTLMSGYSVRAWYDLKALDATGEHEAIGIEESEKAIQQIIYDQHQKGIPFERIFLVGFSQGGAMALFCGLRFPERLAGVMGLSTYLPEKNKIIQTKNAANQHTDFFLAHGTCDQIVPFAMGLNAHDFLLAEKYPIAWYTYPMEHTLCEDEIQAIGIWLNAHI